MHQWIIAIIVILTTAFGAYFYIDAKYLDEDDLLNTIRNSKELRGAIVNLLKDDPGNPLNYNIELSHKGWLEYSANFQFDASNYDFDSTNAFMLAQMSHIAYSSDATIKEQVKGKWKLPNYEWISNRCFVASTPRYIIVVFRGTNPKDYKDWLVDVKFRKTGHELGGKVHYGFNKSFDEIEEQLGKVLSRFGVNTIPVWFTGHSLGGAMALLAAAKFRENIGGIYTYGQPRVGNKKFARAFSEKIPLRRVHRVVYQEWTRLKDGVVHIPASIQGFVHIPLSYWLLARGKDTPVRKEKAERKNENENQAVLALNEEAMELLIGHRMIHYLDKLKKASDIKNNRDIR